MQPSLNARNKSMELKLFSCKSTLHTNVYSRSILETLHWVWDLSEFDNSDTTVCSSEMPVYYDNAIFNFYYFTAVPIGKTCSKSLMRFSNCSFKLFFFNSMLTLTSFSCFKILIITIVTIFANIVSTGYTYILYFL